MADTPNQAEMRARVFISYTRELSGTVLPLLVEKLQSKRLEPLIDKGIEAGAPWRKTIYYWLDHCDGAILLLSPQALKSDWVKQEATILSCRKSRDPRFPVVPVLLEGLTVKALKESYFGSLELDEIQVAQCPPGAGAEGVSQLVDQAARCFDGLAQGPADPGLRRWIEQVKECLLKAGSSSVKYAAEALEIDDQTWKGICAQEIEVAHHVLHVGLEEPVLDALTEVMECPAMSSDHKEALFKLVQPLWVREVAARHVLAATRQAETRRLVAINAKHQETGDCYIRRATCFARGLFIVRSSGIFGEDAVGDILEAYESAFRQEARVARFSGPEGEDILQMTLRRVGRQLFLLIPADPLRGDVVDVLRHRFTMATLVLLSGSSLPDPEELGMPDLLLAKPALEDEEEKNGMSIIGYLMSRAGVAEPGSRDEEP